MSMAHIEDMPGKILEVVVAIIVFAVTGVIVDVFCGIIWAVAIDLALFVALLFSIGDYLDLAELMESIIKLFDID